MNKKLFTLCFLVASVFAVHSTVYAADPTLATEQMAKIILGMEKQPSKDAKITLEDIAKDSASTGNERQLANSLLHLEQKVKPEDKATLMKIWLSPSAAETERALAKALLKFDDKPDDRVKAALTEFNLSKAK